MKITKIETLTKVLMLVTLSLGIACSSCSKSDDDDDDDDQTPKVGSISAKIDGVQWESDNGAAGNGWNGAGLLVQGGDENAGITFNLKEWDKETGTFDYIYDGSSPEQIITITYNGVSYSCPVVEDYQGALTITKVGDDQKISGTFSFTGYNLGSETTIEITDGKFEDVLLVL